MRLAVLTIGSWDGDEYFDEDPDELPAKPVFSCKDRRHNYDGYLHTHCSMDNVVYHFGQGKLVGPLLQKSLMRDTEIQWQHLNTGNVRSVLRTGQPKGKGRA